jgi:hypothetical protein
MRQRVRCPECHHWTDALLVWAAGDCCPACNAPIVGFDRVDRTAEEGEDERTPRPPGRISEPRLGRLGDRPLNRARPLNR